MGIASLADQITEELKSAIFSGRLQPGQRLVETELASWLGVSRGPIREALKGLSYEGLVRIRPRRGAFVVQLDDSLLVEALGIREVLEGLAARWAAERLTSEVVGAARAGLASVESFLSSHPQSVYPSQVFDFHDLLLRASGSELLADMLRPIKSQVLLARRLSGMKQPRVQQALDEHKRVLEALILRDPELAERRMREHMRHSREFLVGVNKWG